MKTQRTWKCGLICGVVCLVLALATSASAVEISVTKDYALYGHIWNTDDGTSTGSPVGWCASTAVMNSFIYLENKYPWLYDTMLSGGDPVAARNALNAMMGTCTAAEVWEGKLEFLDTYAPGTTIVGAMVPWDTTGWSNASSLLSGPPTWDVMWQELEACEDVELAIYSYDNDYAHMLTLTSMHLDDLDGDGTWDPGQETASIDYLDPNNPTGLFEATVSYVDGVIAFEWHNGGYNTPDDVWIGVAYWESPVPEPATILLLGLGGVALFVRKKRIGAHVA